MMKRLFFPLILVLISLFILGVCPNHRNPNWPKGYNPPMLSVGAIVEIFDAHGELEGIVLIQRGKTPLGKALPAGRVDEGESIEHAIRREIKESTTLDIYELRQFHVYSEPSRDPRWHAVEVTHLAKAYDKPKAGGHAEQTFVMPLSKIPWEELAFDHAQILKDYLSFRNENPDIPIIAP